MKFPGIGAALMLVSVLFPGCTEDPNPVGGSLLPITDQPVIKIDTLYPSSHSVSRGLVNSSFSSRIMIGKYLSYESWGMVKFSLPDTLANASITDAKITFRAGYYFQDTLVPSELSFRAFRALKGWLGDSLTLDSLNQGGYYDPTPVSPSFSAIVGDTDDVQFSIDTTMVRVWFANIPDTTQVNNGIMLQPTNTNVIKGFRSFSNSNASEVRPKLTVQYVKNGVSGSVSINAGVSRFLANIDYANLVQNSDRIYVQAGVAYNGYLKFVSTDPVPSKASIHKAELEIVLDPGLSRLNTFTIDSLVTYYVGTAGIDFSVPPTLSETDTGSGQKLYRFQIQQYVQRWVRGSTGSIALYTFSEIEVLDLFTFHGE
ncbi:MAG TPA: hypothetical protein VI704_03195, partial [Bacteroidota bacterium]|nr:hypothetical protein [Bacteroidota bacterium]